MIRLIPPVFSKAVIIPVILPALADKCFNPSSASEKNNKRNTAWLLCTFSAESETQYLGLYWCVGLQEPGAEWGPLVRILMKGSLSRMQVVFWDPCLLYGERTCWNGSGASGSIMTTCSTAEKASRLNRADLFVPLLVSRVKRYQSSCAQCQ